MTYNQGDSSPEKNWKKIVINEIIDAINNYIDFLNELREGKITIDDLFKYDTKINFDENTIFEYLPHVVDFLGAGLGGVNKFLVGFKTYLISSENIGTIEDKIIEYSEVQVRSLKFANENKSEWSKYKDYTIRSHSIFKNAISPGSIRMELYNAPFGFGYSVNGSHLILMILWIGNN